MTTTQEPNPLLTSPAPAPTAQLYVNLNTFALFERPASLLASPKAISTKVGGAFFIAYHLDSPRTYLLVKRAFDAGATPQTPWVLLIRARFAWIRENAIRLFGEEALKQEAKRLKATPETKLALEVSGLDTVESKDEILLELAVPQRIMEKLKGEASAKNAAPESASASTTPSLTSSQPATAKTPIASPESISVCLQLIAEYAEDLRKSYLYNAKRLRDLAEKVGPGGFEAGDMSSVILCAAGPMAWLRGAYPQMLNQIMVLEVALEASAVIGRFDSTEQAAKSLKAQWRSGLAMWQEQVDAHFPKLNFAATSESNEGLQ